jgi:hypothetical protein
MDESREIIDVPGPDDPWWGVGDRFALTFNAYDRLGSSSNVDKTANKAREKYDKSGVLPDSVDGIRTCLFYEQRRWRHFDEDPYEDPGTKQYLRALFAALRELTGGSVVGPGDPYP